MHLGVDPDRVRGLSAAVSQAWAEGVAVSRSPQLLRGSLTSMSAGDGGLASAAAHFCDAWGQSLADAVRELGRLTAGLEATAQLYEAVEHANTMPGHLGPLPVPGVSL